MTLRIDMALDEPTGAARDIRIAARQILLVLATRAWFRQADRRRDIEVAQRRGLRVVAFLQVGCEAEASIFPATTTIVPWDFGVRNQKELAARIREVLA